jgi:hypothetical protein
MNLASLEESLQDMDKNIIYPVMQVSDDQRGPYEEWRTLSMRNHDIYVEILQDMKELHL